MVLEGEFPPDIRVENEIDSLYKEGHNVHIACTTRLRRAEIEVKSTMTIHRKPISLLVYKSSVGALRFPMYFLFWRKFLNQLSSSINFDIIHVHDLPLAIVGYEIAKKAKARFVLDLHEHWPSLLSVSTHTQTFLGKILSKNVQWMKYEFKMCGLADAIIVISEEFKSRLIGFGVPAHKIHIVSNTLNLDIVNGIKTFEKSERFEMFYGGGINKHRGLEIVIDAIPEIVKTIPDFLFKIVGTGNYLDELKNRIKQKGVSNHVSFTGYLPFENLMEQLSASNISVIPFMRNDHSEIAVPHKLFQYIFMEVPILASNCSTISRILNETNGGMVYKWDSVIDFAEKTTEIFQNYSSWQQKMKKAKELVLTKYNWNIDSGKLIQLYDDLLRP